MLKQCRENRPVARGAVADSRARAPLAAILVRLEL